MCDLRSLSGTASLHTIISAAPPGPTIIDPTVIPAIVLAKEPDAGAGSTANGDLSQL